MQPAVVLVVTAFNWNYLFKGIFEQWPRPLFKNMMMCLVCTVYPYSYWRYALLVPHIHICIEDVPHLFCTSSSHGSPQCYFTQFIQGGESTGWGGGVEVLRAPPSPIIFDRQILPQQTLYHWKGNLTASRIDFKYWKNILISRLYEQLSRNDSKMAVWKNFKFSKYILQLVSPKKGILCEFGQATPNFLLF